MELYDLKNFGELLSGVPEGLDAQILADFAYEEGMATFVARDDVSLSRMTDTLRFFSPDIDILVFPAWDCLPFDRVSPNVRVVNPRISALIKLLDFHKSKNTVLVTTISALLQKVPPRKIWEKFQLKVNLYVNIL